MHVHPCKHKTQPPPLPFASVRVATSDGRGWGSSYYEARYIKEVRVVRGKREYLIAWAGADEKGRAWADSWDPSKFVRLSFTLIQKIRNISTERSIRKTQKQNKTNQNQSFGIINKENLLCREYPPKKNCPPL